MQTNDALQFTCCSFHLKNKTKGYQYKKKCTRFNLVLNLIYFRPEINYCLFPHMCRRTKTVPTVDSTETNV